MNNKKAILRLPKALESLDTGVMEFWSIEKDIDLPAITPTLPS